MSDSHISDYSGWVRRLDFILRSSHPYLKTRIFELKNSDFIIFIETSVKSFESLEAEFNNDMRLRFLTTPVTLSQTIPKNYVREIEPIKDKNVSLNFEGIPLNIRDLINNIECRYPQLNLSKIKENYKDNVFDLYFSDKLSESKRKSIAVELNKMKLPLSFRVYDETPKSLQNNTSQEQKDFSDQVFNIYSSSSMRRLKLDFLERDEALWFDNIDNIYKNKFKKKDLFFLNPSERACFIDFSGFRNINLRNHLLLYDVVYCTLPLFENMNLFLEDQKIKREEILYLANTGRLKIVNTQPETRLDVNFLRCIYREAPNSIVSRRALSTLCAIDAVELNDGYLFNDSEILKMLLSSADEFCSSTQQNVNEFLMYFLWPKYALRNSFEELNRSGTKRVAAYGVRNIIKTGSQKIDFEFSVNYEQIYIAHALDATYFPFIGQNGYTDHFVSSIISQLLNMYKCLNFRNYKEYFSIEKASIKNPTQELVRIFEVSDFTSIEEFENDVRKTGIQTEMHSLFEKISALSGEERVVYIEKYNNAVDLMKKSQDNEKTLMKYLDAAITLASFVYPPAALISNVLSASKILPDKLMRSIKERLEYQTLKYVSEEHRQISYLTKINRVARLRQPFK